MSGTPSALVVGGGVIGLCTALLLARDGYRVTVLERDAATPTEPGAAWESWDRRGCVQFRQPHFFLPRFQQQLEAELPDVAAALLAAGAVRYNLLGELPEALTGGRRAEDDRYTALATRRPLLEAVLARAADAQPGVQVRRGFSVRGLLTGPSDLAGVPNVVGAITGDGQEVRADLVIDAGGRRSTLPALLAGLGGRATVEEREDCGFMYFARFFQGDGGCPALRGAVHMPYNSVSVVTLPQDNGTWSVTLVTSSRDRELRVLRDVDRWTAVARLFPAQAHWLDADPGPDRQELLVAAGVVTTQHPA
ncbi:FAD-dependent oxidoreductase [Pseudonocardia alaniniphila]|uniref:FAD-dependent oxidoreductase n=1 Tax=Pseudonocardia alaniniphila TaxID=75291 RepID=A0ABS9TUS9_9PSEU|nr:FAD-dependent oxidoreductase [Pseudonocardia alaniniphila]MCH6172314.1 FAD-dependent oxidoreductase [Pseudonocardia alaniniphila]